MLKLRTFRQTEGYCGPASLKIVLDYYGVKQTEKALAEFVGASRERGVSARSLVTAARRLGFDAHMRNNSSLEDLRELVRDTPVIVDWFHHTNDGHYSVVAGFRRGNIILADPYEGKFVEMSSKEFNERWFDFYGDRPRGDYIMRRMIVVRKAS